jgi:hypothetical protein
MHRTALCLTGLFFHSAVSPGLEDLLGQMMGGQGGGGGGGQQFQFNNMGGGMGGGR